MQEAGVEPLTWDDPEYPASLRMVDGAPPVLYVRGRMTSQDEWAVAIVGTRRRHDLRPRGGASARFELAAGVTVVSGMALGIDTVAHRAAMDAGGASIAVLGSGVQLYPRAEPGPALSIVQQGALISEYARHWRMPTTSATQPHHQRAQPRGIIVVEAGERSGALITGPICRRTGARVVRRTGQHPVAWQHRLQPPIQQGRRRCCR